MRTLIKNGHIVTAVDSYIAGLLIDGETVAMIGKGGLYGNCIRIGPPLIATKDDMDEMVTALDEALATI